MRWISYESRVTIFYFTIQFGGINYSFFGFLFLQVVLALKTLAGVFCRG